MEDQPREQASLEGTPSWSAALRVREPVGWALLALTAFALLVSLGQLLGLVGVPLPGPPTFALRASAVGPQFVDFGLVVLPVLSVVLVTFAGGLTDRARQVVQAATAIEAFGLALGVITWAGALGAHARPGAWFVFFLVDILIAATALTFIAAVLRSPVLQPPRPQYQDLGVDDEEDYEDDDGDDPGDDEVDFKRR